MRKMKSVYVSFKTYVCTLRRVKTGNKLVKLRLEIYSVS